MFGKGRPHKTIIKFDVAQLKMQVAKNKMDSWEW
jgi:hypothetical protein